MSKNNEELKEWYNSLGCRGDGMDSSVVIVKKPESEGNVSNSINVNGTTPGLTATQPDSPQDQIQQDALSKEIEKQLTTKTDNVIIQDKVRVYKAMGMIKALEGKLIYYSNLASAALDNPMKKEDLASEIKMLVNSLSEVVGSL